MKALATILLIYISYQGLLSAQAPDIQWQQALGGSGYDAAYSICEAIEGGFIVSGDTWSNDDDVTVYVGSGDIWVAKIDTLGEIIWENTYGGSGWEQAFQIKQTQDMGFILVGFSTSLDGDLSENNGFDDVWIIKIDSVGSIQWQKSYGGTSSDRATSVTLLDDGGYAIAGLSTSNNGDVSGNHGEADFWVLKINSSGDLIWQKCYGGNADDQAQSIISTDDGGFVIVGHSSSNNGDVFGNHGLGDFWAIKIDGEGTLQWQNTYGGSNFDDAFSITNTTESGYIILGYTQSNDGDITGFHGGISDYWVIKIDSNGLLVWQKCLGGSSAEEGFSIIKSTENTYILAGHSGSNDGDVTGHHGATGFSDFWVVNIDTIGSIIWEKSFGGSSTDEALSVIQTSDLGYLIAGWARSTDGDITDHHGVGTNWDFWIVKLGLPCIPVISYQDNDGDSFGSSLIDTISCILPWGFVIDSSDCDDSNIFIHPSAEDICNNIDDNCNGSIDEDATFINWYLDADNDAYGDAMSDSLSCFELIGFVIDNTDCNDLNGAINPESIEVCNDIDDNCNFDIDEDLPINIWYIDEDDDNFGNSDIYIISCLEMLIGYVLDSTDCNDLNNLVFPGSIEICDYIDNDCNTIVDDNLTYIHSYKDFDSDTFGNPAIDSLSCELPEGFVENNSDCDDANALIYPDAEELLNGIDDNCNGTIDEGLEINETLCNAIAIYPNPTSSSLHILWLDASKGTCQLINDSGEVVEVFEKIYPFNQLDVSKYASGVYLLKINSHSISTSLKFVKIN